MIVGFLTEQTFQKGVTNYLNTYAYSNADQDDFWSALTAQAHEDKTLDTDLTMKQIMDSWSLQTGYPVINVTRNCEEGKATITQTRFIKDVTLKGKSDDCWWVPLTYTTESEQNFKNTVPKMWLSCPKKETTINVKCDEWLLVNIKATGK